MIRCLHTIKYANIDMRPTYYSIRTKIFICWMWSINMTKATSFLVGSIGRALPFKVADCGLHHTELLKSRS